MNQDLLSQEENGLKIFRSGLQNDADYKRQSTTAYGSPGGPTTGQPQDKDYADKISILDPIPSGAKTPSSYRA